MFITFEGVEGAGKTTQIRRLAERLRGEGRDVLVTREPGDGPLGPELRRLALNPPAGAVVDERTELLIMLADRAQHVSQVISPALERGTMVICDRFADSSVAYQGYGRGLDIPTIQALNAFATRGVTPAVTILLDLDVETGLARQADRNRMEAEAVDFHQRIRCGFRTMAEQEPRRFRVIDAAGTPDEVHDRIWRGAGAVMGL